MHNTQSIKSVRIIKTTKPKNSFFPDWLASQIIVHETDQINVTLLHIGDNRKNYKKW